ncbi:uncharacterized protein LOC131950321 [Physella acuta]|uniref:uncharacterized protein LOC131950321 n=1 Tax=Physella acuta TaxID=109671 RepID=UPI0027DC5A75|nr:uncharacterized protein LOC131950321 [Physella acuta]
MNVMLIGRSYGKSSCKSTLMAGVVPSHCKDSILGYELKDRDFINVFEAPSVEDICIFEEMIRFHNYTKEVMNRIGVCINAFLIVLRYGLRYTKQDHDLLTHLNEYFGHDFLRKYCIVLFTHGDIFSDDYKLCTFQEWCDWQDGYLELLYKACNKRFMLMCNKGEDITKQQCRNNVLALVNQLSFKQEPFTLENFRNNKPVRERLLLSLPSTSKVQVIAVIFAGFCQEVEDMLEADNIDIADRLQHRARYLKDRLTEEISQFKRAFEKPKLEMEKNMTDLYNVDYSLHVVGDIISRCQLNKMSFIFAKNIVTAFRKEFEI